MQNNPLDVQRHIAIFLIEDNASDRRLLEELLLEAQANDPWQTTYSLHWVSRLQEARDALLECRYDVILSDLLLPDSYPEETVRSVAALGHHAAIILLSGVNDERLALEAVRLGIQDYLVKGQFDAALLARTIGYAIERKRMQQRQTALAQVELTLSNPGELQVVLDRICTLTTDLLPASGGGTIILWDHKKQSFSVGATTVPGQRNIDLPKQVRRSGGTTRWIVDTGQPLVVPSVGESSFDINRMVVEADIQAYIGVPLICDDQTLGVLYALDREPRQYRNDDVDFLAALANRAAAAIAKVQIFERERQERRLAETLRRVSNVMNASLSLGEVLDRMLACLLDVVRYDSAMVLLIEDGYGQVRTTRGMPHPDTVENERIPIAENPLFTELVEGKKALVLHDVHAHSRYRGLGGTNYERAWLGVPLVQHEEVLGILAIDQRTPGAYTDRDADIVFAFASQAANAIANARLYEKSLVALAKTDALYTMARTLIMQTNIENVFTAVVEGIAKAIACHWALLITVDTETETVTNIVKGGSGRSLQTDISYAELNDGLTGWVLRNRRPAFSPKDIPDPREAPYVRARRVAQNVGSIIVVPVMYRDRVLGTATALNRMDQRDFTQDDIRTIEVLATQAAIAIENARLFEQAKHLANIDGLTGLNNRRRFFELSRSTLERTWTARTQIAAIMFDVDHFKSINDQFGHSAGDQVLQAVARRATRCIRQSDIIGRYGGEEFAVLLPNTDQVSACKVAARIHNAISAKPISANGHAIDVTVSVGVAQFEASMNDLSGLLIAADHALYRAKNSGRNRVAIWKERE